MITAIIITCPACGESAMLKGGVLWHEWNRGYSYVGDCILEGKTRLDGSA